MDPLLLEIPTVIETSRLRLATPENGDGSILNALVVESHPALKPWLPWATEIPSVGSSEVFARQSQAKFQMRTVFDYKVISRETGAFMGMCGVHDVNWKVRGFELGYWLGTRYTKHGYMHEAVSALTRFLFNSLNAARIQIRVDERNIASWRVAERCGYKLEGTLRNSTATIDDTELRNIRVYSRLPGD